MTGGGKRQRIYISHAGSRFIRRSGALAPAMHTSQFFLGPERLLTRDELEALLNVKAGVKLSEAAYYRLELADLITKGLRHWTLTGAGSARLAAGL
jgi:hypothetical protein